MQPKVTFFNYFRLVKYASNRYGDIRKHILSDLKGLYDEREIRRFIFMLIESYTGISRARLLSEPDITINEPALLKIHFAVRDLKKFRPIQYITGKTHFLDLELDVDDHVLIPRPETEELVSWVIQDLKPGKDLKILDIGTGSGCIAIALKKYMKTALVTAVDNDEKALQIAGRNAHNNHCEVLFDKADILDQQALKDTGHFDVIVSNPPYVRYLERQMMQPNVLDYEPESALFVPDDDPLLYYRAILGFSHSHLSSKGHIYVEINENLGSETKALFREYGFHEVELRKDLNGKDRFIRAVF